jgi:hypothetical protein
MKRLISLTLCLALLFWISITTLAMPPSPPDEEYISQWAYGRVKTAISLGFVPEHLRKDYTQAITRSEFAALVISYYEATVGEEITERVKFEDTEDAVVEKAAALGIITGVGGGKFNPNAELNREQAATMLIRLSGAIGESLTGVTPTFKDNDKISSWAFDAVGTIQAAGIMGGVGNNTFAPKSPYTREQSIYTLMLLYDVINRINILDYTIDDSKPTLTYPNCPGVPSLENISDLINPGTLFTTNKLPDSHIGLDDSDDYSNNKFICCYDYSQFYSAYTIELIIEKYCDYLQNKGMWTKVPSKSFPERPFPAILLSSDGRYKLQISFQDISYISPDPVSNLAELHITILRQ